jgi:hypothetical protein
MFEFFAKSLFGVAGMQAASGYDRSIDFTRQEGKILWTVSYYLRSLPFTSSFLMSNRNDS